MSHVHAIVWLDHREAKVIGFSLGESETIEIHSQMPERHIRHQDQFQGEGHTNDDLQFFGEIAEALADSREVLITGPGTAKEAFERYVTERHADLAKRIVGTEPLDHPTAGQLAAYARKYFTAVDQLGLT